MHHTPHTHHTERRLLYITPAAAFSLRFCTAAQHTAMDAALPPAMQIMTYYDMGTEGRQAIGIGDSLVRYSCGVEEVEDIWADLEQALERI